MLWGCVPFCCRLVHISQDLAKRTKPGVDLRGALTTACRVNLRRIAHVLLNDPTRSPAVAFSTLLRQVQTDRHTSKALFTHIAHRLLSSPPLFPPPLSSNSPPLPLSCPLCIGSFQNIVRFVGQWANTLAENCNGGMTDVQEHFVILWSSV